MNRRKEIDEKLNQNFNVIVSFERSALITALKKSGFWPLIRQRPVGKVANADRVREATGATVLIVHHTTKGSVDIERGSGALRGACDTMLRMVGDDRDDLVLHCEKQKDADHFADIPIRFLPHLESGLITARIGVSVSADELTSKQLQILESLSSAMEPGGLSATKWHAVSEQNERTFYRARKALHDKVFVFADRVGRGALYTLTDKGEKALTTKLSITSNGVGGSNPQSLPPAGASLEARQVEVGTVVAVTASGDVEDILVETTP